MSDTYPRVRRGEYERDDWFVRPEGTYGKLPLTHKVVPADAIVIERSTVPPVRVEPSYIEADRIGRDVTADPDEVHAHALALLAIEAYLREHPPVTEAQKRLMDLTCEAWNTVVGPNDVAAFLYARGVRVTEDGAR